MTTIQDIQFIFRQKFTVKKSVVPVFYYLNDKQITVSVRAMFEIFF